MLARRISIRVVLCGCAAFLSFTACTSTNKAAGPSTTPSGSSRPSGRATPAAAAQDWPQYHQNALRSGVSPDQGVLGKVRLAWKAKLDGAVYAQPLVAGGNVIVATERNSVYSL